MADNDMMMGGGAAPYTAPGGEQAGEDAPAGAYEVDVPPGYKPPESNGDQPDVFTATCQWRVREGGKRMCLIKLGDLALPDKPYAQTEKPPSYMDLGRESAGAVSAARGQQPQY